MEVLDLNGRPRGTSDFGSRTETFTPEVQRIEIPGAVDADQVLKNLPMPEIPPVTGLDAPEKAPEAERKPTNEQGLVNRIEERENSGTQCDKLFDQTHRSCMASCSSTLANPDRAAAYCDSQCNPKAHAAANQCKAVKKQGDEGTPGQKPAEETTPDPQLCLGPAQSQINQCSSRVSSARNTCDADNNSDLKTAQQELSSASKTSGIFDSSNSAAAASTKAKKAISAFKEQCSSSRSSCMDACGEIKRNIESCANEGLSRFSDQFSSYSDKQGALNRFRQKIQQSTEYQSLSSQINSCDSLSNNVAQAESASKKQDNTISDALAAAAAVASGMANKAGAASAAQTAALCTTTPTAPGCPQVLNGCQDPASTDQVCVCLRNPNSCMATAASGGQGLGGTGGPATITAQSGTAASSGPDSSGLDPSFAAMNPNGGGAAEDVGGKQGNGANINGTNAFSGGAAGGRGGRPGDDPGASVYGGGRGGGGRGGGSGSYYGGNMSDEEARAAYAANEAAIKDQQNKSRWPDLRSFLPGGKMDPKRNPSGLTGPDGITGPHSNLWLKIHNRYAVEEQNLLP